MTEKKSEKSQGILLHKICRNFELNATGSSRLVEQWEHCSELQGKYVEK